MGRFSNLRHTMPFGSDPLGSPWLHTAYVYVREHGDPHPTSFSGGVNNEN